MSSRHYSHLYRQLRDLDPHDYQRVIRRYEEMEAEVGRLDVLEHFEITTYYVDALYQTGAYRQHQMMVDLVIENAIRHSIRSVAGISDDVYQHLLFRKAAAAFRLHDFTTAVHIGRELVRMAPDRELYVRFLRVALFRQQTATLQFGRAGFVFCVLAAAFLIMINLLWVTPFFPPLVYAFRVTIGIVFTSGLLCLLGAYGLAHLRAHRAAYRFQAAQLNK